MSLSILKPQIAVDKDVMLSVGTESGRNIKFY